MGEKLIGPLPMTFPPKYLPKIGPLPQIDLPKLPLVPEFTIFERKPASSAPATGDEAPTSLSPVFPRVSEGSVTVRTVGRKRGRTLSASEDEDFYGGADSTARRGV